MRNSIIYIICFFLVGFKANAQTKDNSTLISLSKQIIDENNSDSLNLVSIFNWITENIEYDTEMVNNGLHYPKFIIDSTLDSADYIKEYNREVSQMVIDKKMAICDGYSRLFLTLCEFAELKCQLIIGKTKIPLSEDLGDHAWNAVFLNGEWRLVDFTWASGYNELLFGTSFTKKKDMFFYLTPPNQLIYDHLPDDLKWSLLDTALAKSLFYESPIISSQPFQSGLTDYSPKNKAIITDTLKPFVISFEFNQKIMTEDLNIFVQGWPDETLKDKLNINVTKENYDSLERVYPDLFYVIPKIQITEKKIRGNQIKYSILPLTSNLEQIGIYIESSLPSMVYDVKFTGVTNK